MDNSEIINIDPPTPLPLTTIEVFDDSPSALAKLLSKDETTATRVIELLGGFEEFKPFVRDKELLDISNEDFKATLIAVIDRIIKFLDRVMEDLFDGSLAIGLTFDKILFRVEELSTLTRTTARRSREPNFSVKTRTQNLCVRYRPITEVQGLIANLKNLELISKSFFDYQNEQLIKAAFHIPQDVSNRQQLNDFARLLMSNNPVGMTTTNPLYTHRGFRHESLHLMGNHQLVITDQAPNTEDLERMFGISIKLDHSERDPLPVPSEINFQHFSPSIQVTVLRQIEKIAENMSRASGMNIRHRRKERIKAMSNTVKTIRNKLAADRVENTNEDVLRSFIEVLERYIDWLANPYLGLLALSARNLNAALNVCELNIK